MDETKANNTTQEYRTQTTAETICVRPHTNMLQLTPMAHDKFLRIFSYRYILAVTGHASFVG